MILKPAHRKSGIHTKVKRYDWSVVNWNMKPRDIARETGIPIKAINNQKYFRKHLQPVKRSVWRRITDFFRKVNAAFWAGPGR